MRLNLGVRQIFYRVAVALVTTFGILAGAFAQVPVPTAAAAKNVMALTKNSWVQFRNYEGKQYLYFTHFISWKCGLKEVRYSINGKSVDQKFPLPECNRDIPFDVDVKKNKIYLSMPLGTARSAAVQLVYKDGSKSDVLVFEPCDVDRDQSCAKLVP